jgi:2-hydroxychromene-2-carboxylate isomerase
VSAFYFDFSSPESYLAAERILQTVPVACEWVPIRDPSGGFGAFRCAEEEQIARAEIERLAAERGMQAVRWPPEVPFDAGYALRAATYAKQIGRVVQFSLAAYRQAYAGGWDLRDPDVVLIAGSACEMHPTAVKKAVDTRLVGDALDRATAEAIARGVVSTPAIWTGAQVVHGDARLEDAAALLAEHAAD